MSSPKIKTNLIWPYLWPLLLRKQMDRIVFLLLCMLLQQKMTFGPCSSLSDSTVQALIQVVESFENHIDSSSSLKLPTLSPKPPNQNCSSSSKLPALSHARGCVWCFFAWTQSSCVLKLLPLPTKVGDRIRVAPPRSVSLVGEKLWKNNLVGYILHRCIPFFTIQKIAQNLWSHGGLLEVLSNGNVLFSKFASKDLLRIPSQPWYFLHWYLVHEGRRIGNKSRIE